MVSEYLYKRPFYSCVLSCQAFDLEWGWRWPCCDRDQYLVSMISNQFKFEKQQCLYHNKINLSLTSIQRVGRQAGNCKMGYSKLEITVHCNLIHAPYEKQQQQKKNCIHLLVDRFSTELSSLALMKQVKNWVILMWIQMKKNFGSYTKHSVRWINPQKVNSPNNLMHCWMYRQWEFKRIINKEILFGINTKFSERINRAIYWHHLGEITFRYNELKNGPPAVKKSEEARNQLTIKSIISHWPKGFWCRSSCVQHGTYLSIL